MTDYAANIEKWARRQQAAIEALQDEVASLKRAMAYERREAAKREDDAVRATLYELAVALGCNCLRDSTVPHLRRAILDKSRKTDARAIGDAIDRAARQASSRLGVDPASLSYRTKRAAKARWLVWYVLRQAGWSYPQIGAEPVGVWGTADHSTVRYALGKLDPSQHSAIIDEIRETLREAGLVAP